MDGEKQWTYFSGVITILRSVMRDDKINEYETKAVCGTLNLYDVPGISIFVRGVKLYNKQMVRNLFARNIERINRVLFDLRPKPKVEYKRKGFDFSAPIMRDLPSREPSDMEKASMELLRNDEVFYDNLLENNRHFPSYRDIYNKKYNNMAKKIVRLTESGLHRLISESVKKAISNRKHNINESYTGNYRGVDGVKHIWHGEWADPEVEYDGKLVNYWDIDEYMQDMADSNGINIEDTEALNQFCIDNEDAVKQYIIDNGQPIDDGLNEMKVPMNRYGDIEYPSDEEHRPGEWFDPHNNRVPQGWEMMNREDDEPLYRDEDYNEYVKYEYGHFRPVEVEDEYDKYSFNFNEGRNRTVKLNESQLKKVIAQSVKRILKESSDSSVFKVNY